MPATIKKGSSGADVSTWQGMLTAAGYSTPSTGLFDDVTDAETRAWQTAKGLVSDGIVGAASWGKMTGGSSSSAPPGTTDPHAAEGRAALSDAWHAVTGQEPTLAELQIAGAQGQLESNYGHASYKLLDHATGQVLASSGTIWNWGAVQGEPGFLATDTSPLKVTADNPKGYYDHHYRSYASSAEGAADMVKQMTTRRPTSWALMKAGDIDAWAQQMWAGYVDGKLNVDPQSGVPGYFEQKPSERAKGIEQRIANIAFTLGEPIAAKRGGPVAPGEVVSPDGGDASSRTGVKLGAILAMIAAAAAWWFWGRR